ncbi:MAG: endo alpha-1,4 polygalactosaminidase [Aggregatibacter aphrophilus]|uniref:endo alpha-1,4 polygalactosaminidase n=1 Tax=Aggregatibacter aphrophilus TaxID=732 RepID=UPI0029067D3B|nr:endo alpha-1,4 polygalactosaminidase [Aggregatibacter aphrophilus]MDU7786333.1 endo alpha-1,4 polygalactosaminidase [Aggregatibacter aphrophilus]
MRSNIKFLKFCSRFFVLLIAFSSIVDALPLDLKKSNYGVFIGINGDEEDKLQAYDVVVIEPAVFEASQIEKLHASGKTVYGYINIGAIEEYRPYYYRFRSIMFDIYETWPDERWIDVSSPVWQHFIINELGKKYADMGMDGFFLDNADIYYHYHTDEIFQGLVEILGGLRHYNIPLIINGGDLFVKKCIEQNMVLIDGINQESVFTTINFENGTYGIQREIETAYFQKYLTDVKAYGLSVYLLEYHASEELSKKIDEYTNKNGFLWYNATGLELR